MHDVRFATLGSSRCTVVALTQPSLRGLNVGRRRYAGVQGHDAELLMLRHALDRSRIGPGRDNDVPQGLGASPASVDNAGVEQHNEGQCSGKPAKPAKDITSHGKQTTYQLGFPKLRRSQAARVK